MTWTGAIQTRRRPTTRSKPASRPGKGGGPALLVTPCPYHLADPAAVWTLWTPPWGLGCATRRPADPRGDCGEGDLGGKGQVRSSGPDRLCGVCPRGAHGLAEGVVGGGGARCCEQSWPGDTFHNSCLALHRGSPPGTWLGGCPPCSFQRRPTCGLVTSIRGLDLRELLSVRICLWFGARLTSASN